jgi:hypothetical protein
MAVGPRTVREEEETDIGPAGVMPLIRCGRVTKLLQERGGGFVASVAHSPGEEGGGDRHRKRRPRVTELNNRLGAPSAELSTPDTGTVF